MTYLLHYYFFLNRKATIPKIVTFPHKVKVPYTGLIVHCELHNDNVQCVMCNVSCHQCAICKFKASVPVYLSTPCPLAYSINPNGKVSSHWSAFSACSYPYILGISPFWMFAWISRGGREESAWLNAALEMECQSVPATGGLSQLGILVVSHSWGTGGLSLLGYWWSLTVWLLFVSDCWGSGVLSKWGYWWSLTVR